MMNEPGSATGDGVDVIEAVRADHREIETLFTRVDQARQDDARRDAFEQLVRKLAVHETAEEEVVHPLGRRAPDGDAVVEQRLQEEDKGKKELAELEKTGIESPDFEVRFARVRTAVLDHAQHEEQNEHPLILANNDEDRLRRATSLFRAAEKTAPTHPHAMAPESATGNVLVGMFASVADRARDAIRNARDDGG